MSDDHILKPLHAGQGHVEAFKALAHAKRLEVFFFLVKSRDEMAAGEIQEALGLPGPTLSRHLELLRRAGLIGQRKDKRFIYYRVNPETTRDLARLLTACC